jgi:DNA-binding beta-propeller fold protein YncE
VLSLALASATGLACATANAPQTDTVLTWPEPPLVTRIETVRTIARARDIQGDPSFWESVGMTLGVYGPSRGRALAHPADVAVSPDGGTVYVSDFAQGIVHAYDLERGETRYLAENEPLDRPLGLAVEASGNLWVVEQAARQLRLLSPEGATLRVLSSDELVRPVDVAVDEQRGRMYVVDGARQKSPDHYVHVFDTAGNHVGRIGEGKGSGGGHLLFPTYATLDAAGNLFVSDTMNSRIAVFDPEGTYLREVGERGNGIGMFDKPKGVAVDSFGNVYVVDSSWSNVQIFGPEGDVLLYFGGRGGHPGLLRNPTGIAISATNTIFVADYLNHRLSVYRLVNTGPDDGIPEERRQMRASP